MSLAWVDPVAFQVAQVVEHVGGPRSQAEGDEGDRHRGQPIGAAQHAGAQRRGDDQQVLGPLLGTQRPQQADDQRRLLLAHRSERGCLFAHRLDRRRQIGPGSTDITPKTPCSAAGAQITR